LQYLTSALLERACSLNLWICDRICYIFCDTCMSNNSSMSFSGTRNSQHCGGLLVFIMIAAVFSHYWPLLCQVKRRVFVFHLKELLHN